MFILFSDRMVSFRSFLLPINASPSSWHWYGASLMACSRLPDAGQRSGDDDGRESPLQEATREAGEAALLRARTLGLGQGGKGVH